MSLRTYQKKRNFKVTQEPSGVSARARIKRAATQKALRFVVQRHAASHLHYDFRLELNGTLKSWAVPKQPIADPKVKRLAIEVEDHPLEYADFQGTIPEGQYGAGTVTIWDTGTWDPPPHVWNEYQKGHLQFTLHGQKLKGRWQLIRTHIPGRQPQWLLMKIKDAAGSSKNSASFPIKFVEPQLATLRDKPPSGPGWIHELKYDGYRTLAGIEGKEITLWSRSGLDWTDKYKALIPSLQKLKCDRTLIDGEMTWINEKGFSDFGELQRAIKDKDCRRMVYFAFDLLQLNGENLQDTPLSQRKERLQKLLRSSDTSKIVYSQEIRGDGPQCLEQVCQIGFEGIVSKRLNDPYISGRTESWIKSKCANNEEFIVGGFTAPQGSRSHFGSLLIGSYDTSGHLVYHGRIGTGFNDIQLADVLKRLAKLKVKSSPFTGSVPVKAQWVKPQVVIQVSFRGWTQDNIVRQGSFKGIREDKPAKDVGTSPPKTSTKDNRNFTNLDKVLFPKLGITKGQMLEYYEAVSDLLLPHVIRRPLALLRCPDSVAKECFFQKQITTNTAGIQTANVKTSHGVRKLIWIEDQKGLLSLAQLGVVEIHAWQATIDNIDRPDQIIWDLDPDPTVGWDEVKSAAVQLKKILQRLNLKPCLKLTGGKGLHIQVSIQSSGWEEAKDFSKTVASALGDQSPDRFTLSVAKKARPHRIFIDYLRNGFGATAIVPYSLRAKPHAPVAMPIDWQDLARTPSADAWSLQDVLKAIRRGRRAPW